MRWTVAVLATAVLVSACGGARRETRESRGSPRAVPRASSQAGAPGRSGRPPTPATPDALVGPDTVTRLQRSLAGRGLLAQHRQGELDAPTRQAVKKFQDQQGLAATGIPDRETLRKLDVETDEGRGAGGDR